MKHFLTFLLLLLTTGQALAYNMNDLTQPSLYRSYNKQQIRTKDTKGNLKLVTPHYDSYKDRNNSVSEKVVAIYDKHSPAYGYRYVLYTPVGHYVGYHKIYQPSPNGYGFEGIPDGGEDSKTPCFKTVREALHYYYPQWY